MDLILRVVYAFLGLYWAVQFVRTVRRPADWEVPTPPDFPVRITRTVWLAGSVIGMATAVVLFIVTPTLLST
jgi:hypothetical protein